VLAYLSSKNLSWRVDSSNLDERFSRVFLRKQIMPLLRRLNPSLERTISIAAEVLGKEDDFLNELADGVIRDMAVSHPAGQAVDASAFADLPAALQRRILRRLLLGGRGSLRSIEFKSVEAMRRCALGQGTAVDLGSVIFAREEQTLLVRTKSEAETPTEFRYSARPGQTIRVKEVDKTFSLRNIEPSDGVEFKKLSGPGRALLDADAVGDVLELRNWLPGDRYRPLGAPGRQKLQDLFINSKIPRLQRLNAVVFLAAGRICWVSGLRISEEFKITPKTARILVIEEVVDG
jgi:tRNA(Ile)-lysidine synthase